MKKRLLAASLALMLLLTGCNTGPGSETQTTTAPTESTWIAQEVGVFQAEDGVLSGGAYVEQGFVTGFENDGDSCTVTVSVPETGFYDLTFTTKGTGGYKENYVSVDGENIGTVGSENGKFGNSSLTRIYLEAGEHQVTLSKYWGYISFDKVTVWTSQPFDESIYNVSAKLVNPNASDNAKRVFSYMCDIYGDYILSGQYCDTGMNGWEIRVMADNNGGKYPAVLGLDMIEYSPSRVENGSTSSAVDQAIACWEKGGIVTFCWHWNAPSKYITGEWYSAFYTDSTNIDLSNIMDGKDTEGYELLMKDIDAIAQQLQILEDAGVPILWRPLHEASGGWFWWGADGAEAYKQLYVLLYEKLTNEYGLDNLIWLWNGQDAEWYPGDQYVDIIGIDIYAGEGVHTSQIDAFLTNHGYGEGNKMVVLSENGTMIDPELSFRDRAMWGFFAVWGGEFVMSDGIRKSYSEQYTSIDMMSKVYNSEYVITRDELPDLHTYPIREDAQ